MTAGVEDGMDHACCIVVFLAQASYRSVAHRQHVDARIMALISSVNGNFGELAGSHASSLQHLPSHR